MPAPQVAVVVSKLKHELRQFHGETVAAQASREWRMALVARTGVPAALSTARDAVSAAGSGLLQWAGQRGQQRAEQQRGRAEERRAEQQREDQLLVAQRDEQRRQRRGQTGIGANLGETVVLAGVGTALGGPVVAAAFAAAAAADVARYAFRGRAGGADVGREDEWEDRLVFSRGLADVVHEAVRRSDRRQRGE
jgi:hypothetical protein